MSTNDYTIVLVWFLLSFRIISGLSPSNLLGAWILCRGYVHLQEGLEGAGLCHHGSGCVAMPTGLFRPRDV